MTTTKKTILITGCSSGFGLEIAKHFLERGWNVIATMRTPREGALPKSDRLRILPLDVTDDTSIRQCVAAAGPIDALVNNAGIGWLNALEEGTPMRIVRDVFETNTFGTIAMTQAVIPGFRERRAGVIVNVTSTVTLRALPLLSVYTASKAAINAFTESVALELAEFGVRARLVLPGRAPDTKFGENARAKMTGGFPDAYASLAQRVFAGWQGESKVTKSSDVAEAVWDAVVEEGMTGPMRRYAGEDAREWARAGA